MEHMYAEAEEEEDGDDDEGYDESEDIHNSTQKVDQNGQSQLN